MCLPKNPWRDNSQRGAFSVICHYYEPLPSMLEGGGVGLIGDIWEKRKNHVHPPALCLASEPWQLGPLGGAVIDEAEGETAAGEPRPSPASLCPATSRHTRGQSLPTPGLCLPLPVKLQLMPPSGWSLRSCCELGVGGSHPCWLSRVLPSSCCQPKPHSPGIILRTVGAIYGLAPLPLLQWTSPCLGPALACPVP